MQTHQQTTGRAIGPGMIGNFAIYGFFAVEIGCQFFSPRRFSAALTSFAATLIVEKSGNHLAPAFLIMGAAAIAFIVVLTFKET